MEKETLAQRGKTDLGAAAYEQRRTGLRLQLRGALAHGGLAYAEPPCRRRKTAAFGKGDEYLEPVVRQHVTNIQKNA